MRGKRGDVRGRKEELGSRGEERREAERKGRRNAPRQIWQTSMQKMLFAVVESQTDKAHTPTSMKAIVEGRRSGPTVLLLCKAATDFLACFRR
jgi:hypothetical protein